MALLLRPLKNTCDDDDDDDDDATSSERFLVLQEFCLEKSQKSNNRWILRKK